MATITLGTLRDYWKRVYDAITGPPGSTAPTYAMQVGGSDGTNLRAIKTDTDGHPQVDVLSLPAADVTDRPARVLGVVTAADGGLASIGAKADAAVTDPTLSASEIALLKGLLKQLQGGGTGAAPVTLNGSSVPNNQSIPARCLNTAVLNAQNNVVLTNFTRKHPVPPRIDPVIVGPEVHEYYTPTWVDKNGVWWAANKSAGLRSSPTGTAPWTTIMPSPNTSADNAALIISDTGRAIWCTTAGHVYVSDESKSSWSLAFQFTAGYCSWMFGHCKYKNIILLASYGSHNAANSPRFVYASFDHGATWQQIYEGPNMDSYHIHDVCYDPWADRIWITEGDTTSRQILYSDDRGATWVPLYPTRGTGGNQATAVLPGLHGVAFVSDWYLQQSIGLWPRPFGRKQQVNEADIIWDYWSWGDAPLQEHGMRPWYNIENSGAGTYYVIGTTSDDSRGYARLIVSYDLLHFYEIWRSPAKGWKIGFVTGPHPADTERRFYARLGSPTGTIYELRGQLPSPVNV